MSKTTQELLKILKTSSNIEMFLSAHEEVTESIPLHLCLKKLLQDKNLTKSQCIQDSGLQRNYGYQIFSGERTPSRDKLLALCLAMHLTADEVHTLFCSIGFSDLYPKNQRDSVFIFAFNKRLSALETNELLLDLKMELMDI